MTRSASRATSRRFRRRGYRFVAGVDAGEYLPAGRPALRWVGAAAATILLAGGFWIELTPSRTHQRAVAWVHGRLGMTADCSWARLEAAPPTRFDR